MGTPAIAADDLHKSYGEVVALDGVSFAVPFGSVTGLLGRNGSGKTTTVAILATSVRADAGGARVAGFDVARQPEAVRRSIGFAGQFAAVDANLTGTENLVLIGRLSRLGRRQARRRAVELAERFGITDAAGRLVRTYSGGMRRRLDLAAALVASPPVVFLDEPTTGLDPESRHGLWETITELVASGTTVLLTTQYLEEADALCDQVVIIERGRVVATGTPAELKASVGTVVIELTFPTDTDAQVAADRLVGCGWHPERSGSVVSVRSERGSQAVVAVARDLDGVSPDPRAVSVREATLDDAFLALTATQGATASGSDGAGPGPAGAPAVTESAR